MSNLIVLFYCEEGKRSYIEVTVDAQKKDLTERLLGAFDCLSRAETMNLSEHVALIGVGVCLDLVGGR